MRITILDQEFNFENKEGTLLSIVELIEQKIKESNLIYSHLIIDGSDLFVEYQEYFSDPKTDIHHVEVKLVTPESLINDMLLSAVQYTKKASPEVKALSDEFYQGATSELWSKLEQLVEAIQWFQQTAKFIEVQKMKEEDIAVAIQALDFSKELESLMEAVQNQDSLLLGDILQYEILPRFEQMAAVLPQVVQKEVVLNEIN